MLLLTILGAPLAWDKTACGMETSWVGFSVNLKVWSITLTSSFLGRLVQELADLRERDAIPPWQLRSPPGRLCHALQLLQELRPFLQPLFAMCHAPPEHVPIKDWVVPARSPCKMMQIFASRGQPLARISCQWQT